MIAIVRAIVLVCSLLLASGLAFGQSVTLTGGPGKGFTMATADDRFAATLRARAQIRETLTAAPELSNELNVKTVRLYLQGHVLSPQLKYFVQLALGGNDFEAGSSTPLFDAWIEYTRLRDLNVRVGQFFVPFDRARTIREFGLQFVDRPQIVSELSLDRDVGIMLYSTNFLGLREILSYNLGVFGGEGKNRFGGGAVGFLYVMRLSVRPFGGFDDDVEGDLQRQHRPRLMVGLAGAYNQNSGRQRSTTGSSFTVGTFDYLHAAVDTVFKYAGLSLLGEVLYRQGRGDSIEGMNAGKVVREWSRSAWGYLVQSGLMLSARIEATARFGQMFQLGETDPTLQTLIDTQGSEIGGGLNLYLNGHMFKVQADYVYLYGTNIELGRHVARLQLDATF